jgi:hypothetical protein
VVGKGGLPPQLPKGAFERAAASHPSLPPKYYALSFPLKLFSCTRNRILNRSVTTTALFLQVINMNRTSSRSSAGWKRVLSSIVNGFFLPANFAEYFLQRAHR